MSHSLSLKHSQQKSVHLTNHMIHYLSLKCSQQKSVHLTDHMIHYLSLKCSQQKSVHLTDHMIHYLSLKCIQQKYVYPTDHYVANRSMFIQLTIYVPSLIIIEVYPTEVRYPADHLCSITHYHWSIANRNFYVYTADHCVPSSIHWSSFSFKWWFSWFDFVFIACFSLALSPFFFLLFFQNYYDITNKWHMIYIRLCGMKIVYLDKHMMDGLLMAA